MRSRLCTVALQCLIPQTPFPKPPAGSRRGRNGGGRFLCIMRGMRLVLVALVSANVAFFHAGCRFERTTARCAVETRKWGRETASFSAAIKGRGEGTSPVLRKKWRLFFKSPRLSCETRGLLRKTPPFFGGLSTARGRKKPDGIPHSAKVKIAAGGLLGFPPPTKSTTPIKPRTRTTFWAKWCKGGGKKDFFPRALVTKCDA